MSDAETTDSVVPAAAPEPAPRPKPFYSRLWFRVVLYAVVAYAVWCAVLYYSQDNIIFPADLAAPMRPKPIYESTVVTRLDVDGGGQVESWFIPAPGVDPSAPGPVVVFFHGNAETIDYHDHTIEGYHRLGLSVLLPEYRGYGRAAGRPSQDGIVADAVRFIDLMRERPDVDPRRMVIHGRSLGGGVAAQVAARREPAALILESTFTSLATMAYGFGAPAFLAKHPFRTDRVIRELDLPVLIFHGSADTIIPVHHGRKLRDLARDARYTEFGCGHNDLPGRANHEAYWAEIRSRLEDAGVAK